MAAREARFESWTALKTEAASKPSAPRSTAEPANPTILKAAIPVLFVSNVARSAEFFRGRSVSPSTFYMGTRRSTVESHATA